MKRTSRTIWSLQRGLVLGWWGRCHCPLTSVKCQDVRDSQEAGHRGRGERGPVRRRVPHLPRHLRGASQVTPHQQHVARVTCHVLRMPCDHVLCLPCFNNTLDHANIACPICRLRISVWCRKASKVHLQCL